MEKSKITGYEPAAPLLKVAAYNTTEFLEMPIQLELASRIMAARITGLVYAGAPAQSDVIAIRAMQDAKALIDAYNNQ